MSNNVAQLVRDAANDGGNWNALYRRFYPGMFAIALRICQNKEIAADAVQDAFIIGYLKISQLKEPEKFAGWIKQIVIHACYRAMTTEKKHFSLEKISDESNDYFADVINKTFDDFDEKAKLFGALSSLPDVLSSSILLRYLSSYQSYDQIATILGIPAGTVKSRLNQAKAKLIDFWQQREDVNSCFYRESEEWNTFYKDAYGGMHLDNNFKDTFMHHVSKSILVSPKDVQPVSGRIFESMVAEDREVGSWLQPTNVVTSGNVSVIEATHYNSSDHPNHCPEQSVVIIFREGAKASKVRLHVQKK